jgi:hypothetical protein
MDTGELLTRWAVRVALMLYLVSLTFRLSADDRQRWLAWARLAWTSGFAAYLLHVACAFHFYHHWSHAAAYEATARQTEEALGFAFGGGVFVNYFFALVWGADVCWWWCSQGTYLDRWRIVEWALQGFLAFIAFNGTVIFGHGAIRWFGLAATAYLVILLMYSAYRKRPARDK